MLLLPLAAASYIALAYAAPQGNPNCADVPVNPAAGQIGAEYLTIPGCGDDGGSVTPIDLSQPNDATQRTSTSSPPSPADTSTPNQHESSPMPLTNSSSPPPLTSIPSSSSTNSSSPSAIGTVFKSTITRYGQGPPGTPGTDKHCQAHEGACGNNPKSGWTAAASQFLYFNSGSGTGDGQPGSPGAACGTCWRVTGVTDSTANTLSPPASPAVVLITNECAAQDPGQPVNLCGMASLTETNSLGANVNIDLCMDSGAAEGFFAHAAPWGTAVGTAQQVDCASEWCGVWSNGTKSGPKGCQDMGVDYPDTT